jgi:DNA-binding FadR family transcriptional regulator
VIRHREILCDTPLAMRVCLKTVAYGCRVGHPQPQRFASRRLADVLRAEIIAGGCPPGSRILSYRQLRDAHGVAINTAQAAIRILAAEGLVEIRPARGAYVCDDTHDGDGRTLRAELADLRAALRRSKEDLDAAEGRVVVLLSRLPSGEMAP